MLTVSVIADIRHQVVEAASQNGMPPVMESHHDRGHLNHYYDDNGRIIFTQFIFENLAECGEFRVQAWRLVSSTNSNTIRGLPVYDYDRNCYYMIWHDSNVLRKTYFDHICETDTQYDPEIADRDVLPKEKRSELPVPFLMKKRRNMR